MNTPSNVGRGRSPVLENPIRRSLWTTLLLSCFVSVMVLGQEKGPETKTRIPLAPERVNSSTEQTLPPFASPKEPVNCELAGRYMDDAISRARRAEDTPLLAIIRPGEREPSARISHMRLLQVKAYLEYTRFSKYVVATGEKVQGFGRIELYVAGKLLYALPLQRNRGINLLSCVAV